MKAPKTKFKRVHLDRLIKLADHLTTGKLIHERFNISVYNDNPVVMAEGTNQAKVEPPRECDYNNGVAQMGNAIGECPGVFPHEWVFLKDVRGKFGGVQEFEFMGVHFIPALKDFDPKVSNVEMRSALRFFQLTESEYHLLFSPYNQREKLRSGWFQLTPASRVDEQVYNLWRFISEKSAVMSVTVNIPAL